MSNEAAFELLQTAIDALNELPGLPAAAAPEIALNFKEILAANIAAQRGPDGTKWPPTAAGTPALEGASANLQVKAIGSTVVASLSGHHALHHLGRAKGGVRRQILPWRNMPEALTAACEKVLTRRAAVSFGGGDGS